MKLLTIILATLCLSTVHSLRILEGDQLPKESTIGKIMHVDFTSDGRIFFSAEGHSFGWIDGKTGKIIKLYILEDSETIIDSKGDEEMVIAQGK